MTPEDVADLIGAEKIDRRLWAATCPVHNDQKKALRISFGAQYANVVCLRGCSLKRIIKGLPITLEELYSLPSRGPDLCDMEDEERAAYRSESSARQSKHKDACERLRAQQAVVEGLEAKILESKNDSRRRKLQERLDHGMTTLEDLKWEERGLRAPGTSVHKPQEERGGFFPENFNLDEYRTRMERMRDSRKFADD